MNRHKGMRSGGPGAGKTLIALRSPFPLVIDTEDGTQWYKEQFPGLTWLDDFDPTELVGLTGAVIRVVSWDKAREIVRWAMTKPHGFRSLVIDGMTNLEKSLDDKWTEIFKLRNQKSTGFKIDYYVKQPADYKPINADRDSFLRDLTMLDMNVIITCRLKDEYEKGEVMKATGDAVFDGHRSLTYWVDTGLYQFRGKNGEFMARVGFSEKSKDRKDRTNKFPTGDFEMTDDLLVRLFGDGVTAAAKTIEFATPEQCAELQTLFDTLFIEPDKVKRDLAKYGATEIADLTAESAAKIIATLTKKLEDRKKENNANV